MATTSGSTVLSDLETLFSAAIGGAFAAFPDVASAPPMIAACNNASNGDYQCNNAMPLFGKLKGREGAPKAPRDIAQAILGALPANGLLASTSLAGPGFINLRIAGGYVGDRVNNMLEKGMDVWAPPLPVRRLRRVAGQLVRLRKLPSLPRLARCTGHIGAARGSSSHSSSSQTSSIPR